jgi:regulator of replication initiation timing
LEKHIESPPIIDKQAVFQGELKKLTNIFAEVEESKRKMVDGLVEEAAFLYAEDCELRNMLKTTGMIRINPNNPSQQKPVPAATQYLKNINSYAVVIKTLNGVLMKNIIEEDDDMGDYE